jgi:hypothetical protein
LKYQNTLLRWLWPEIPGILKVMREACPKPGTDYIRAFSVMVHDEEIIEHDHVEHAVLCYVRPTGPIVIEGEAYLPEVGPGTMHSVPACKEPRISIAMLIGDE